MICNKKSKQTKLGFSLFELSIVMLISALFIAAIAKGSRIASKAKILSAQSTTNSSPIPRMKNLLVWYETTMEDSFNSSESNSGSINTWYNLNPAIISKTNSNANNAIAGVAPTYKQNAINGLPALVFNGTSNYFTFNGTSLANSDYSVAVVEQRLSQKSTNYYISGNDTTTLNYNLFLGYRLNGRSTFGQTSNAYEATIANYSSPITRIHIFRFKSAVGKDYYLNGVKQTLSVVIGGTPSLTTGLVSNNFAQIGRHFASSYYAGQIGEIIILNRYINDDERRDIEKYLGKKWGITI